MKAAIPEPSTDEATRLLESCLWSMWSQFGRARGCTLVDEPEVGRFETPIGRRPYNTVVRFAVDEHADVDDRIDGVLAAYRRRAVPVTWVVNPGSVPDDLVRRLALRGLRSVEPIDGMTARLCELDLSFELPGGITIDEVTVDNLDQFVELVSARYAVDGVDRRWLHDLARSMGIGQPHSATRSWIAVHGSTPLAKATLHTTDGCVGMFGVATRPEARGLGLARAVAATALRHARHAGHELAVLHSTPMAVGLYHRLGFRHVADFALVA